MEENNKIWESEYFALNFHTGELERGISPHYFQADSFESAQKSLVNSKLNWVRLTGNWFSNSEDAVIAAANFHNSSKEISDIDALDSAYEALIDPHNLVKDMSIDDFLDWLNISNDLQDVLETLKEFRRVKMTKYERLIIGHLKHKYGYTEDQEGLQLPD